MSDIRQNDQQTASNATFSTSEIMRETGITVRQVYYWEMIGLIRPAYQSFGQRRFRRYGQRELERILEIRAWLDLGYSLEAVRRRMTEQEEVKDELL
jgi:DNA-binding transcriptional MerR regulator